MLKQGYLNQGLFFNSKLVDLSSNLTDGEGPKKLKEGSSDKSSVSNIPEDVFTGGLKFLEYVAILLNSKKHSIQTNSISLIN